MFNARLCYPETEKCSITSTDKTKNVLCSTAIYIRMSNTSQHNEMSSVKRFVCPVQQTVRETAQRNGSSNWLAALV